MLEVSGPNRGKAGFIPPRSSELIPGEFPVLDPRVSFGKGMNWTIAGGMPLSEKDEISVHGFLVLPS